MSAMRGWELALLASVTLVAGCHERPRVLSPDFVIDFGCRAVPAAQMIEGFMRAHGFFAFDEEAARKKRGHSFFVLQVDGYDSRRVMLDVIGLRRPESYGSLVSYHLTITGPPPSRHDARLEKAALDLVHNQLGCKIFAAERFDNGPQSSALFQSVFKDEWRRTKDAGE